MFRVEKPKEDAADALAIAICRQLSLPEELRAERITKKDWRVLDPLVEAYA